MVYIGVGPRRMKDTSLVPSPSDFGISCSAMVIEHTCGEGKVAYHMSSDSCKENSNIEGDDREHQQVEKALAQAMPHGVEKQGHRGHLFVGRHGTHFTNRSKEGKHKDQK